MAPNSAPIDPNTGGPVPGLTPRQQVPQSVIDDQANYAQIPGWQQEHGIVNKALAGGAALGGQLAGFAASPEGLITGPESAAESLLARIAGHAGVQAAVQGAGNAAAQGINVAASTQDQFSPAEAAQAAATGGLLGAGHTALGAIVTRLRGAAPEPVAATADPDAATATAAVAGLPPGYGLDADGVPAVTVTAPPPAVPADATGSVASAVPRCALRGRTRRLSYHRAGARRCARCGRPRIPGRRAGRGCARI